MTPLHQRSATELHADLAAGTLTSREVVVAFLDQIERYDNKVGAFLHVDREGALQQAEAIDRRRASGKQIGSLEGLPVAVKDVFCTKGQLTTCGSRMLENFVSPYDAGVIEFLRDADAVLLGKTNMDEFAMGASTENSALGTTCNPWDDQRVPGGSSGGSAACVAARMAPLALGTDTGGSIRQPAAFCGVSGLKPTYGRVSRYGLIAFASSLDQAGPMAASAEDLALLLQVIAKHDARDSTSVCNEAPAYVELTKQPIKGLKIGRIREHFAVGLDQEIEAAVDKAVDVYRSLEATVSDVPVGAMPHMKYGVATYYIIAPSEASSNLARYDGVHYGHRTNEKEMLDELKIERDALGPSGDLESLDSPLVRMYRRTRAEGFGSEVKRRIMLGTYALSAGYYDAYYLKALKFRRLIHDDYVAAFKEFDVLLGPTTATPAFGIGEFVDDPLSMYLQDITTVTANLAGIPALSIPCGFTEGRLPIGLQLQAAPMAEATLLRAAHMYQQTTDWHKEQPVLS